jgi:alpha-ketoglutarate-dependent taurine dioxygenase
MDQFRATGLSWSTLHAAVDPLALFFSDRIPPPHLATSWERHDFVRLLDLPASRIAASLRSKGALLFRGFVGTIAEFKLLSERLCSDFMSYQGGATVRHPIGGDSTMLTVSGPSVRRAIALHGEMYYAKERPGVLFFYCVTPAAEDGETTLADGVTLFEKLKPATRRLFEESQIKYLCTYPDGRWQQLFQTEHLDGVAAYCDKNDLRFTALSDRAVRTEYTTTAVGRTLYGDELSFINNVFSMIELEASGNDSRLVRLADGAPLPKEVIDELRQLNRECSRPLAWQAGDLLVIDNTRFLHGRRAFTDADRAICVRLGTKLRSHD